MIPTYPNNAYVWTDKFFYRLHDPARGDVVIFTAPLAPENEFIERIIAVPSDQIMLLGGDVYLNGEKLVEPYIFPGSKTYGAEFLAEGVTKRVPPDRYFFIGDNREHTYSSHIFGFVSRSGIHGRVMFCYAKCTSQPE